MEIEILYISWLEIGNLLGYVIWVRVVFEKVGSEGGQLMCLYQKL